CIYQTFLIFDLNQFNYSIRNKKYFYTAIIYFENKKIRILMSFHFACGSESGLGLDLMLVTFKQLWIRQYLFQDNTPGLFYRNIKRKIFVFVTIWTAI
ncbi:hypothetical protein BpHYR1_047334, partial [Brachionus plicatilis]